MLHGVLPLPEPYAGKLACTVLRGLGDGNIPRLPDTEKAPPLNSVVMVPKNYYDMKIQRIYVDTSVIGGCFDSEFSIWSDGLMRDFRDGNFKPVISEIVAEEIGEAPVFVREKYAELIGLDAEYLEIDEESMNLFSKYDQREILTEKYRNDMLHISLATVAGVDIVTSWNFRHIVRFDKIRAFNSVNIENGYRQLEIYSPREVTTYGDD